MRRVARRSGVPKDSRTACRCASRKAAAGARRTRWPRGGRRRVGMPAAPIRLEDVLIKVSSVASTRDAKSMRDMIEALIAVERDPRRRAGLARDRMRPKYGALIEAMTVQIGTFTTRIRLPHHPHRHRTKGLHPHRAAHHLAARPGPASFAGNAAGALALGHFQVSQCRSLTDSGPRIKVLQELAFLGREFT